MYQGICTKENRIASLLVMKEYIIFKQKHSKYTIITFGQQIV